MQGIHILYGKTKHICVRKEKDHFILYLKGKSIMASRLIVAERCKLAYRRYHDVFRK